ncbi:MAG: hypothetical protein CISAcid_17140 [uncultured Acidilobus sp. CIS]|nr:MAG: hypothetical protein CISAcid_17140 [uncultured Acidilobus sp. CIS]
MAPKSTPERPPATTNSSSSLASPLRALTPAPPEAAMSTTKLQASEPNAFTSF